MKMTCRSFSLLMGPLAAALLLVTGCDDVGSGAAASVDNPPRAAARSSAAENPPGWPAVEFEPPLLDFGVLPPGGSGRAAVKIWNVGATPLGIKRGIVSCGCTKPDQLDGRVIQPGSFTEFSTTMEMKSGLGEKKEKLTIFFHGYERVRPPVEYFFHAEVSLPVRATPPHLTALDTATNQDILTGRYTLESLDGQPFRVLAVNGEPPTFVDFDPATDTPRNRYTLFWDLTRLHAANRVPWFWIVQTDRADCPIIDLRVRHRSTRRERVPGQYWAPRDLRLVLNEVRNGAPVVVETKVQYPAHMPPEPHTAGVSTNSSILEAKLLETWVEEAYLHYRIQLTPRGAPPGLFYEQIRIHASNGAAPIRIIGLVTE